MLSEGLNKGLLGIIREGGFLTGISGAGGGTRGGGGFLVCGGTHLEGGGDEKCK